MRKGYVTVYFSLVLMLVMSLLIGMLYAIRENAIRNRIREAGRVAILSEFGEYQRYLWDKYKVICVDAGYGNKEESLILAEEHIINCLNENFDEDMFGFFGGEDLLKLSCDNAEIENVRFVTDNGGHSLVSQAISFVRFLYEVEDVLNILNMYSEAGNKGLYKNPLEDENKKDAVEISDEDPLIEEWTNEAKEAVFETKDVSLLSTLRVVLDDISSVSTRFLNEELLFSKRSGNKGNYEKPDENRPFMDKLFFIQYLSECCSNYIKQDDKAALTYELEYLIAGHLEDEKNLESVVNKILLMREMANMITLYSDAERIGEINGFCETISALVLNPELAVPMATLIVMLWSYIESLTDVRTILSGKKVPLIKTPEEWKSSIADIFIHNKDKDGYDKGLEYTDYLKIFLVTKTIDEMAERLMNSMEACVRVNMENTDFRLDYCFDAISFVSYVESDFGYSYAVSERYDVLDR